MKMGALYEHHIDEWLSYVSRSHATKTVTVYRSCFRQLSKFVTANGNSDSNGNGDGEFCADTAEKFLESKLARKSHNPRATFNTYLIILRGFATWRQKKYDVPSPVHDIQFTRTKESTQMAHSLDGGTVCGGGRLRHLLSLCSTFQCCRL